jgi:hypothetical protein
MHALFDAALVPVVIALLTIGCFAGLRVSPDRSCSWQRLSLLDE